MSPINLDSEIKKCRETLNGIRDEIKVQVHLGTMEVKETWRDLEPQLLQAEKAGMGVATEATRALLTETIKKLVALKARIPH